MRTKGQVHRNDNGILTTRPTLALALMCAVAWGATLACSAHDNGRGQNQQPKGPGLTNPVHNETPEPTAAIDDRAARQQERHSMCPPAGEQSDRFVVARPASQDDSDEAATVREQLADIKVIRAKLESECQTCHAPNLGVGGFRFVTSLEPQLLTINGEDVTVPGLKDTAAKMESSLRTGQMPPNAETRAEYFAELGDELGSWIAAGMPHEAAANTADTLPSIWGLSEREAFTGLGDCVPTPEQVAPALKVQKLQAKDQFFAGADQLPARLSETDLVSLDSSVLAQNGTYAYDVQYPLWNDFARKLRHVHVPLSASAADADPQPLAIALTKDPDWREHEYDIPDNTRFYKTFFAQRRTTDGQVVYRPMETRIIVVRKDTEPLYGTYVWKSDYSDAELLETPYRDGTAWKDLVLEDVFDGTTDSKRKYVVPARHRCVQCHEGTSQKSFVLGFSPYQLHIRDTDHSGQPVLRSPEWLGQMDRLRQGGVLTAEAAAFRPQLENFEKKEHIPAHRKDTQPFVADAQGYFLGNCAHCHNPAGYAYRSGQIKFDLRAGKATEFPTHLTPTTFNNDNLKLVSSVGNLDVSYLFRRVAGEPGELRGQVRMPLHTPGSPDCAAVDAVGRWILSYNPSLSADEIRKHSFGKPCAKADDFTRPPVEWIDEDPTVNERDYTPRRADWNTPSTGMPDTYRTLVLTESLTALAKQEFPTGWWLDNDEECSFPVAENVEEQLRAYDEQGLNWIRRGVESQRSPKTLGQLYLTSPGAHFFSQTCVKCHGRLGKGDGVIAKDFRQIEPANFVNGMFGLGGDNLHHFDAPDQATGIVTNYASQYFVWMAMEGTRLREIPPAAQDIVGKYGGRMLGQIRDNCFRLLTGEKQRARDGLLYEQACTFNNLPLTDPTLALDVAGEPLNRPAVEAWLDHAAQNAGLLIFQYVRDELARGSFRPSQGECNLVEAFRPR
jgi:mono/diheme cytochrome c family protein